MKRAGRYSGYAHGALLLVLLGAECVQYARYTPDPEKDVGEWVANFSRQRSFRYEYEAKMTMVRVEATGSCVVGRGEKIHARWHGASGVQDIEYVGLGDVEYARSDKGWKRGSRGEQSDVHAQMKRILVTTKYEYQGYDGGYSYRFMANVPFLAPERRKEMVGVLRISVDNYLPSYIWAGLPDSSVYWAARIFDYNSAKEIKPPVRARHEFFVIAGPAADDYRSLDRRLKLAGVDHRMRTAGTGRLLSVPVHYTLADIAEMVRPGGLTVYAVSSDAGSARSIRYLMDDPKRPVLLSEVLLTERDVADARIRFDRRSTPYLSLKLRQRRALPHTIALEVDSILVTTVTIDTLAELSTIDAYPDMTYHEMEILRAYIIQPLGIYDVRLQVE